MKAFFGIAVGALALLFGPLASSGIALQPDGPFLAYKERKASEWAKDDEQIATRCLTSASIWWKYSMGNAELLCLMDIK